MAYNQKFAQQDEPKIKRAKLPKDNEIIGVVEQRLGGNKMQVACLDGKSRVCRVPGRLRRRLWLRPGDTVIVEPWELDKDKADILYKYKPNEVAWLKREGYLEQEDEEF